MGEVVGAVWGVTAHLWIVLWRKGWGVGGLGGGGGGGGGVLTPQRTTHTQPGKPEPTPRNGRYGPFLTPSQNNTISQSRRERRSGCVRTDRIWRAWSWRRPRQPRPRRRSSPPGICPPGHRTAAGSGPPLGRSRPAKEQDRGKLLFDSCARATVGGLAGQPGPPGSDRNRVAGAYELGGTAFTGLTSTVTPVARQKNAA